MNFSPCQTGTVVHVSALGAGSFLFLRQLAAQLYVPASLSVPVEVQSSVVPSPVQWLHIEPFPLGYPLPLMSTEKVNQIYIRFFRNMIEGQFLYENLI